MPTTEKQITANRQNGKLGGVKTPEGKAVSSRNSIKHGILSRIATDYDWVDLQDVYQKFAEEFDDSKPSRRVLIEQLAITYVRMGRCIRYETESIRAAMNPPVYKTVVVEEPRPYPFEMDMGSPGVYKQELVKAGDPATLPKAEFADDELISMRYEPHLLSRFARLLELLRET